jgi:hypothetical protein
MEQLPPMDLYGACCSRSPASSCPSRRSADLSMLARTEHWTDNKARQRRVTAEGVAIATLRLA